MSTTKVLISPDLDSAVTIFPSGNTLSLIHISSQTIDPVASLSLFLPSGILDYFTLVNHVSQDTCFILYLEEKATIPSEYSDLHLHSKGFLPEIEVQDFPIRGKAVYLRIKRRRWEDPSTGQTYSRDWSLVATGTRITAEFGAFLKELLR